MMCNNLIEDVKSHAGPEMVKQLESDCLLLQIQQTKMVGKEKIYLFWMHNMGSRGVRGWASSCLKAAALHPPPCPQQPGDKAFLQTEGRRLPARTTESSSTILIPKVVIHSEIDQCHLDYFDKELIFIFQELAYSHFLEASSWNSGSLCNGYSLVIMKLTTST